MQLPLFSGRASRPGASRARGPVGHCTSGRPLNPPLLVWQIDRRCLGLPGGFRGWPIRWNHAKCCGADPCCHGNEIWARRGNPVAYRLVFLSFLFLRLISEVARSIGTKFWHVSWWPEFIKVGHKFGAPKKIGGPKHQNLKQISDKFRTWSQSSEWNKIPSNGKRHWIDWKL